MIFYILFGLLILASMSFLAGKYAEGKGRNFWKVFSLSMITSPLVGIIVSLFLNEYKKCQFCSEYIRPEASVCKHCNKEQLEVLNVNKPDEPEPEEVIRLECPLCHKIYASSEENCPKCGKTTII